LVSNLAVSRLGIANPDDPAQRVKNEFVVRLRTNINF